jgi:hypothetical protein
LADLVPQPASLPRQPLHASAPWRSHSGLVRVRSVPEVSVPEVSVPEVSVPEVLVPEASALVVPGGGRHRRPASPRAAKRPLVLGVLVLMVALAAVLGVRVVSALSSARSSSVASAAYGQPGGQVVASPADQSPPRYGVI